MFPCVLILLEKYVDGIREVEDTKVLETRPFTDIGSQHQSLIYLAGRTVI